MEISYDNKKSKTLEAKNTISLDDINEIKNVVNTNDTELRGQILWTNSNPTKDIPTLEINLNSSDYDMLEIIPLQSTTSPIMLPSLKLLKGYDGLLFYTTSTLSLVGSRRLSRVSDTKYNLGAYFAVMGDGGASGNRLIPLYIIGYKTNLFN